MTTSLHDLAATTPGLPCRTVDPELFFSTDPTERQYAASLCRPCPIRLACISHALDNAEPGGVWGGIDIDARVIGCGTVRGFRVHVRRGEEPCVRCTAAHEEHVAADRRRRLAVEHAAGGSAKGYGMHRRMGEEACVPCKAAQARQSKERRERERQAAVRPRIVPDVEVAADPLRGAPAGAQPLTIAA